MNNLSQISNESLELNQANTCEAIMQLQPIVQPTQLQSIKISLCRNKEDNRPVSGELTWEELKSLLTTFDEAIISKDHAPAFIGGYFDGKGRKFENLLSRTLITLDIDKYNGSISDLEAFIDGSLNQYRYVAYSTSRHSETDARIRIVLFPHKEIRPSDYKNIVTNFMSIYFLTKIADIPSSTLAAQLMYLPIRTSKEYLPWYKVNDGLEVDIDSFMEAAVLNDALSAANDDNFRPILTKPRCNLSDDEVIDCLTRYDVSGTDFTMWRDVGFALHHQYCGSDKGRELFVDWSLEDTREEYKHTKPVRKNAERQYDSCDNTKGDQITFATIMYRVKQKSKITWKHVNSKGVPLITIDNYQLFFDHYQIKPTYNIIKKRDLVICPHIDTSITSPDLEGDKFNEILSLCILHGLSKDERLLRKYLSTTAHQNSFNPIKDALEVVKHDGVSRIDDFYSKMVVLPEHEEIKRIYLKKWLKQFIFMTCLNDSKRGLVARQVLVLQGDEGIGKTTFLKDLLPLELQEYFTTVAAVDFKDDMQVKNVIEHAIVELGELPATFRKTENDVFKAFVTKSEDKINIKYQVNHGSYRRNTTLVASVNDTNFLNSNHENTRLLIIPVLRFDWDKKVDMLQLYAELLIEARKEKIEKEKSGQNLESIYELSADEKKLQKTLNHEFEEPKLFEELLKDHFDFSKSAITGAKSYSTTDIWKQLFGHHNPTIKQSELNACGLALRKLGAYQNSKKKYKLSLLADSNSVDDFGQVLPISS